MIRSLRSTRKLASALVVAAACLVAAAPPALKGWGQAIDPDGDCRFEQVDDRLSIGIPGTLHNLVADSGQLNAPVVLSSVSGEFIALVKAAGSVQPGPESSVADSLPYNGTGLLLWVDRDNYIRLERAGIMRDGAFITYANLEHFSRGRRSLSEAAVLQDLPTYLRLERRGKSVYASLSQDGGVNWSSFPKLEIPLPDELKLGVAAVNSSTKPFTADLAEFRVFARKEVQGR